MLFDPEKTETYIRALEDYFAYERLMLFVEFKVLQERYYAEWKDMNRKSRETRKHKKGSLVMTLRSKKKGFYPSWDILSSFNASVEGDEAKKKKGKNGKELGNCKSTYIIPTGTKVTNEVNIKAKRYRTEDVIKYATDWELPMFKDFEKLVCELRVRRINLGKARRDALTAIKQLSKHYGYVPRGDQLNIDEPEDDVSTINEITIEQMEDEDSKLQLREEYQHLARNYNVEDPRDD